MMLQIVRRFTNNGETTVMMSRIEIASMEDGFTQADPSHGAVILSGNPKTERDVETLAAYRNGEWTLIK